MSVEQQALERMVSELSSSVKLLAELSSQTNVFEALCAVKDCEAVLKKIDALLLTMAFAIVYPSHASEN